MRISNTTANAMYRPVVNSGQALDKQSMASINQALDLSAQQATSNEEMDKYIEANPVSIRDIDVEATNAPLTDQFVTYIALPEQKSQELSPKLFRLIKTRLNYIEQARPDISESSWDFTLVDGKFKVTSSKLSNSDKAWLASSLNGDKSLLTTATEFTELATFHFETTKENFSGGAYNAYLKQDTIRAYYDVKTQLAEKLRFKDFYQKIVDYGNEVCKNAVRTPGDIYFPSIGISAFEIVEATSLTQGKEGIGPDIKYFPVDESTFKAVPRNAPNAILLAQLYQSEKTEPVTSGLTTDITV